MTTGRFFPGTGVHLGPTGDYKSANMTAAQVAYLGAVGQIFEDSGKAWRLVKFSLDSAVATIDGGVAYWKDKPNGVVTAKASVSETLANGVAGGTHVVTSTDATYLFIQVGGDQAAVVVAASAVKGDHLTGHASTDNVLTRTAGGTAPIDKLVAVAMTTRGTTTSDNGASVSNSSKVRWELGALL